MVELQPEKLRDVYKALSNVNRIKLLLFCKDREYSVAEISAKLKISYTLTSEYITSLEKQDLVRKTKRPDNTVGVKSLVRFKSSGEFEIV